ncbi:hypothetical protein L3i20_v234820 [Paenibacillus sp. L3-i20]|nr:hypothetical protein L3i20_v234820 [Paenibacillus sp. L3-i20]
MQERSHRILSSVVMLKNAHNNGDGIQFLVCSIKCILDKSIIVRYFRTLKILLHKCQKDKARSLCFLFDATDVGTNYQTSIMSSL